MYKRQQGDKQAGKQASRPADKQARGNRQQAANLLVEQYAVTAVISEALILFWARLKEIGICDRVHPLNKATVEQRAQITQTQTKHPPLPGRWKPDVLRPGIVGCEGLWSYHYGHAS